MSHRSSHQTNGTWGLGLCLIEKHSHINLYIFPILVEDTPWGGGCVKVLNQVVSEWWRGGMAAGGAPVTALDPRGCLTLHHILRAFTAPITEEHAWAVIHQVITSSPGHLITWTPHHLTTSSPGHLITWQPDYLTTSSPVPRL